MSKKVAFGIRGGNGKLGLSTADYICTKKSPAVNGDREIFRDNTGKKYDEEHYGDETAFSEEYMVHKTATAHDSWTRGGTVNGYVLDDWTVDEGNQKGTTLSVNFHVDFTL